MRLRLLVRLSPSSSYTWEHDGPLIRIGRNPTCELPFAGEKTQTVSWHHAQLDVQPAGVYLSDLGSSNGTYVNGRVVRQRVCLRQGDQVSLGQTGPRLQVLAFQGVGLSRDETFAAGPAPALVASPIARQALMASSAAPVAKPVAALPVNGRSSAAPAESMSSRPVSTMSLVLKALHKRARRMWVVLGIAALLLLGLMGAVFYTLHVQNVQTAEEVAEARKNAAEDSRKAREEGREEARKARADALKEAREEVRKAAEKARAEAREEARREAEKVRAEASRKREPAPLSGPELYQRTLRSTAFVAVQLKGGARGNGTGSLIDRKRRLVLTAYHVVDKVTAIRVVFPIFDREGMVIADRAFYNQQLARILIKGRVVASNPKVDLALIELESIPADVPELPLAAASSSPGSRVHTVGNPGSSAGLWAYTVGAVRQVARRKYAFPTRQVIDAWVVETQNPINKGDSGGPVVNDKAELVAVNSGGGTNLREGTLCIDVREVKTLLAAVK